jgi:ABC-type lipoprotein release transport system permease subunit
MKEGSFFDDTDTPQVIVHYKTAPTFNARPGDTVTLTGKDLFGQVVVQEAVLKGFFAGEQDSPSLAEMGFMNMAAYQRVSGLAPDETMSIFIDLPKGSGRAAAIAKLGSWAREEARDLEFWDYDRLPASSTRISDLTHTYDLMRLILEMTGLLIMAVVTFGIMGVVSVNLYDRSREIGTYYCLGAEKAFLTRLYTLEILLLNLVSAIAGVLGGLGIRQIINSLGVQTEISGLQIVFGGSQLSIGFSASSVLFIIISIVVITLLAAVFTIGGRLRVPPVAALRQTD